LRTDSGVVTIAAAVLLFLLSRNCRVVGPGGDGMDSRRVAWIVDLLWLAVFGGLSSVWCLTAAGRLGATFDEPFYLQAGMESWRLRTTKPLIDTGAAPGPMLLDSLPLVLWERWSGKALDPVADHDRILSAGRAGTLVFWWLLLAYGYVAGRQLAGAWGGRLAVALLATEPSFLAHAGLATADIAVTALLLAFWVHARAGRERSWTWRVGLPGLLYGLALFAKISALPLAIIGMAVIEFDYRLRATAGDQGWRSWPRVAWRAWMSARFRRDVIQVFWVGILLLFLLCGSDWRPSPSFVKWAETLPDDTAGSSMRWLAGHLTIFSNAGNALGYQIRHNMRGHTAFLLGTSWPRAVWYYFPIVLSIKLTIGLLILPLVLLIVDRKSLRNWACLVALALLLFSLSCRVQTGVRFMLPLVAAAMIGLAGALVMAARDSGTGWRRRLLFSAALAIPVWAAWSSAITWPNGLSYVNELWGGPAGGYLLVCDSNYDWGQGLPELTTWAEQHGPVDVLYYGTDYAGLRAPLRNLPGAALSKGDGNDLRRSVSGSYLAVGTSVLYSPLSLEPQFQGGIAMLRTIRPRARTATFLIYRAEDIPEARAEAAGPSAP
jgi:hypothetical protein